MAGLNPVLNSLACRPLLWRGNVNDPNNSAADADEHLSVEAEAGHSALHAIVVMKTEWRNEVKFTALARTLDGSASIRKAGPSTSLRMTVF